MDFSPASTGRASVLWMVVAFLLCDGLERLLVEALSMASVVKEENGQTIVRSFEVAPHGFAP